MHWNTYEECILSLDISTEALHKFGLPKADRTSTDESTGDGLNLLFIDVWIMKEYSNKESWSKQYSIGPLSRINRPISILKNNRILLGKVVHEYDHVGYYDVQLVACDLFNYEQLLTIIMHSHGFSMLKEILVLDMTLVVSIDDGKN
ncbi:hypothetical protein M9H77_09702 [Catharanthus roseus]|uniref:Uncharacterized protein n=1 Tax=Catharanthus roseus TaxID=4058 RepID=A0ACC0C1I6_CATRO|nr:hypothetical protein M9H77_09702 [Catharanthus roseus]